MARTSFHNGEYWKKTPREEEALLQDRQLLVSFIEKKWSDGHMYCLHLSLSVHTMKNARYMLTVDSSAALADPLRRNSPESLCQEQVVQTSLVN
jgi:hypothetical protein